MMWTFDDAQYYTAPDGIECPICGEPWPDNEERTMCEECLVYGCSACVIHVEEDDSFQCEECRNG